MSNPELIRHIATQNDSFVSGDQVLPPKMINIFETSALGGARLAMKGSYYHYTIGLNSANPITKVIDANGDVVCDSNLGDNPYDSMYGIYSILPIDRLDYSVAVGVDFIDSLDIGVGLGIESVELPQKTFIFNKHEDATFKSMATELYTGHAPNINNQPMLLQSLNVITIKMNTGILAIRDNLDNTMSVSVSDQAMAEELHNRLPTTSALNMVMMIMSLLARLSPVFTKEK